MNNVRRLTFIRMAISNAGVVGAVLTDPALASLTLETPTAAVQVQVGAIQSTDKRQLPMEPPER